MWSVAMDRIKIARRPAAATCVKSPASNRTIISRLSADAVPLRELVDERMATRIRWAEAD